MATVTEHFHKKRLRDKNINIKTKYKDGESVCERNSDNSRNDDIKNGVILNKTYFKNGTPVFAETDFNPSLLYSFVINKELEEDIECMNCGMKGNGKDFLEGCPYCGSIYTIDYSNKKVGAQLNTNYVIKDKGRGKILVFIIDFIICLILSSWYCITTGRTFTVFDILKILGIALAFTGLLFYPLYALRMGYVRSIALAEKEKKNQIQAKFWESLKSYDISKEKFFNNFNNELNEFFFDGTKEENKNVIDFDVVDYDDYSYFFDDLKRINIKVKLDIRVVEMVEDKVKSSIKTLSCTLVQNEIEENPYHPGIYVVKCHGCGATVDIMKNACEHCGAKVHYLQSWYITEVEIKNAD
ncbi:MAG: hypothetical protein IJS47_04830 [Clostridia bacterium]|nr:hypothetical protein [Clostridia bacterium]